MSGKPLVSICIPAFNAEITLRETLDSVLRQDYENIEIIVSDNKSIDATREIVFSYGEAVRYFIHDNELPEWAISGPPWISGWPNWDFVLSQGNGEFLCLYHADDMYQLDIVSKQVQLMMTDPSIGAVFTMAQKIDSKGRYIRNGTGKLSRSLNNQSVFDFHQLFRAILINGNFLPSPSVMIRKEVLKFVGRFDGQRFQTSADLAMWLQIARTGYKIAIIDEPLLKYRISQKQFGEQYLKMRTTLADFFLVMDHFLNQLGVVSMIEQNALKPYDLYRAVDYIECAVNLLVLGEDREAYLLLKKSMQRQYFIIAHQHLRRLFVLILGLLLLISTYVGLGAFVGKFVHAIYNFKNTWKRRPVVCLSANKLKSRI